MNGPIAAAIITGLVALLVLVVNQYRGQQDARRKDFAEALAAVERYAELPYRIIRRQGSTPEVRERIAELIHEIQQDLLFHKSWMHIQAPRVAEVYEVLLLATRDEAGSAMSEAWKMKPIAKDEDMPLGIGFSFPRMEEERNKYIRIVAYELEFPPFRWTKDIVPSRLGKVLNNSNSGRYHRAGKR